MVCCERIFTGLLSVEKRCSLGVFLNICPWPIVKSSLKSWSLVMFRFLIWPPDVCLLTFTDKRLKVFYNWNKHEMYICTKRKSEHLPLLSSDILNIRAYKSEGEVMIASYYHHLTFWFIRSDVKNVKTPCVHHNNTIYRRHEYELFKHVISNNA